MKKTFITLIIIFATVTFSKLYSQVYEYNGTIDTSKIHLTFEVPSRSYNFDSGEYYYMNNKKEKIYFKGEMGEENNEKVNKLYTYTSNNSEAKSGYFVFDFSKDYGYLETDKPIITGKWYSMDGKKESAVVLQKYKPIKKKVYSKKG